MEFIIIIGVVFFFFSVLKFAPSMRKQLDLINAILEEITHYIEDNSRDLKKKYDANPRLFCSSWYSEDRDSRNKEYNKIYELVNNYYVSSKGPEWDKTRWKHNMANWHGSRVDDDKKKKFFRIVLLQLSHEELNIFLEQIKKYIAKTVKDKKKQEKIAELEEKRFIERQSNRKNEIKIKANKLRQKYSELVQRFFEIAYQKVAIIDDYGEEKWDSLNDEMNRLFVKIAKAEKYVISSWHVDDEYELLKKLLTKEFKSYYQKKNKTATKHVEFQKMTGVEFETYLSKLLKTKGYHNVYGTPASGDQGADLIAKKDGRTIVIQAKRYTGTVGNKAVQEVVGAIKYYDGDEGWVVTNSTFTPSAKALAQKNNIRLINGNMINEID